MDVAPALANSRNRQLINTYNWAFLALCLSSISDPEIDLILSSFTIL